MDDIDRQRERYAQEIDKRKADLAPVHDGAVFYTNNQWKNADDHVARRRDAGLPADRLETTKYGATLDKEMAANWDAGEKEERLADPTMRAASKQYAQQASGRTEVFCGGEPPRKGTVFHDVERDELIRNKQVTHINGVPRQEYVQFLERGRAEDHEKINQMIVEGEKTREQRLKQEIAKKRELEQQKPDPWGDGKAAGREQGSTDPWGDGSGREKDRKPEPGGGRTR